MFDPPRLYVRTMLNYLVYLLVGYCLLTPCPAQALSSPEFYKSDVESFLVNLDVGYFDDKMSTYEGYKRVSSNLLNYKLLLGANVTYHLNPSWHLQSGYNYVDAELVRQTEPLKVRDSQKEYWSAVQWQHEPTALRVYGRYSRFDTLTIQKYQFNQVLFGKDITLFDPVSGAELPVVSVGIDAKSAGFDALYIWQKERDLVQFSGGYQYSRIEPKVDSALFNLKDQFLLDSTIKGSTVRSLINDLKTSFPQDTTWSEHTFSTSIKYVHDWNNEWSTMAKITGYAVSRSNYQEKEATKAHHVNGRFDVAVNWKPQRWVEVYCRAQAMSNYLLGIEPGSYNRRTSHLFEFPFGYVGTGVNLRF